MKKPRVSTRCVANYYARPGQRIIEFSFPDGRGGLISFETDPAGGSFGPVARVHVYRIDTGVAVTSDPTQDYPLSKIPRSQDERRSR